MPKKEGNLKYVCNNLFEKEFFKSADKDKQESIYKIVKEICDLEKEKLKVKENNITFLSTKFCQPIFIIISIMIFIYIMSNMYLNKIYPDNLHAPMTHKICLYSVNKVQSKYFRTNS